MPDATNTKDRSSFSTSLRDRLNTDMDYCGLSPAIQNGFLFYLGASTEIGFAESGIDFSTVADSPEELQAQLHSICRGYAESTGDFNHYGQLNDHLFTSFLYSTAYILINQELDQRIDDYLRQVTLADGMEPTICWKGDLVAEMVRPFEARKGTPIQLNTMHNLLDSLFRGMGQHLAEVGFGRYRSYEAGVAYFHMMRQLDSKGTTLIMEVIRQSLTPMYMALHRYPVLQFYYPEALNSNHIFSSMLQFFYGGLDPAIVMPIHRYHQVLFYSKRDWRYDQEQSSDNFRIPFSIKDDVDIQHAILYYGTQIRESDAVPDKEVVIASEEITDTTLIGRDIDRHDFYNAILKVVYNKYGLYPTDGDGGWNYLGDFIQYCAILFYETCLHATVLGSIEDPDKK